MVDIRILEVRVGLGLGRGFSVKSTTNSTSLPKMGQAVLHAHSSNFTVPYRVTIFEMVGGARVRIRRWRGEGGGHTLHSWVDGIHVLAFTAAKLD